MIGWLEKHMLPCGFKAIFGIDCPGCGFQRSVFALLKGDLHSSLSLYPATIPILITALFLLVDVKFRLKQRGMIKTVLFIMVFSIVVLSYSLKMYHLATL